MPARKAAAPRSPPKAPSGRAIPPKKTATPPPFMRFHHSVPLRAKTLAVLDRVEAAPDPTRHRVALADIVVELTRAGLEAYFTRSLKAAKAGYLTEQSANLGMAGAVQVMASVTRSIIGGMGAPQLLSVCASIRQFMR